MILFLVFGEVMNKILPFYSGYLSQFYVYRCSFIVNNIEYNCAEQFMMAGKARLFKDEDSLWKIMHSVRPKDQKNFGRLVKGFDEDLWNIYAQCIVYKGNLEKFGQNHKIKDMLLSTGDKILVEASPYDKIWGVGIGMKDPDIYDPSKWKGKNWLGEVLMLVRKTLRKNEKVVDKND